MGKNRALLAAAALAMLSVIAAGFLSEDRLFSELENRLLAEKPVFSISGIEDKSFQEDYETYLTDQFPGRKYWITGKTMAQRLMGKKDANGVYFAKSGGLIERHSQEDISWERAEEQAKKLAVQAADMLGKISGRVTVLLAPTADCILEKQLPAFACEFDQETYLKTVARELAENEKGADKTFGFVDLAKVLKAHEDEYIYYRTDHHWTTLGAFYAWREYCVEMGFETPELEDYEQDIVNTSFEGTLQAKVNTWVKPDEIRLFTDSLQERCRVFKPENGTAAGFLYDRSKLEGRDKYAVFLGGNYPFLTIETQAKTGRSLLVVKDSYANCLIPFLVRDYSTIYVLDPRYYRQDYSGLPADYQTDDVLFVYNIVHFIKDFR